MPRNPGSHAGIRLIGNQLIELLIKVLEVNHPAAELLIDAGMFDVVFVETFHPVNQCFIRRDAQAGLEDFVGPSDGFRDAREIEESNVRAGAAAVIGEEKVISLDVVLVDGFFDQAHAKDVREKGVILFGAACDGGDVVDSS
ncbi:hypothetical protein SDC9_159093 [bioreactor metagenome]|uniref:Uncharacterized protein n=1 Tax=bioreactor metagenome TaxID=1076179 RepID=A0A645FBP5_9ZZZZ